MIWEYSSTLALRELIRPTEQQLVADALRTCAFCKTAMSKLHNHISPPTEHAKTHLTLYICPVCGWWNIQESSHQYTNSAKHAPILWDATDSYSDLAYLLYERVNVACGSLKQLDLTDASIPMRELEAYLIARYSDRHRLNPRRFEEIVAGVFADFGFKPRVTSFTGDDGIDVVLLDGPVNDAIGIQVKRIKGKVGAEQIRSFAGALLLNGIPRGIYVTTSSYTRGARKSRDRYLALGKPIELVDSQMFYDCLRVKQRTLYSDPFDSSAPWHDLLLHPQQIPNFSSTTDLY